MKIAYSIFHSKKLDNVEMSRSRNVDVIRNFFSKNFDYIESKTFIIKSLKDFKITLKENPNLGNYKLSGTFRFGAIGLIFGTINLYKTLVNTDYNFFVILEDDAQIFDNSAFNILKYIEQLPKDFDILSLYENPKFYNKYNEVFDCGLPDLCFSYNRMSTLAYVISRSGIEKYLSYMEKIIDNPIDFFLFDPQKNTKQYAIKPTSEQVVYSDFFRLDNGEPLDEHSQINNTDEFFFK